MKLASLRGGRGGRLVVVNHALTQYVVAAPIAMSLQDALDNWEIALGTVDWIRIGQIYLFLLVSAAIMGWYIVDLMIRDWHDGHRKAQ